MGNSLRCCIACVLPCGALDLIRIVHLNGHVEELSGPITASEVLKNYPNHALSKPCSQGNNMVRRILILSPETELKRGSFYFLIPATSVPEKKRKSKTATNRDKTTTNSDHSKKPSRNRSRKCHDTNVSADCDRYLRDITSENKSSASRHARRNSRVTVWRPHLESIYED